MNNQSAALRVTVVLTLGAMTLLLMACTALPAIIPAASPTVESSAPSIVVAYANEGDLYLWDEATGQSTRIFSGGDVLAVWMGDDSQPIAFLRRTVEQPNPSAWLEEAALWIVDRSGENARELVSATTLRQQLNAGETDSTTIGQLAWLPGTQRLIYSGMRYSAQGEGVSHARPEGVFLIDLETGATTVLASAGVYQRFVPAPGGRQLALLSATGLSFVDLETGQAGPEVLTYPQVGAPFPLFASGVWTQNAGAFLLVAPSDPQSTVEPTFTLWRVPVDGSPAEIVATIPEGSHPDSVTFAPNGKQAAFYRWPEPAWLITPLTGNGGPLAIPARVEFGWANLHWSPSGTAFALPDSFAGTLFQLCLAATQATDVCGNSIELGSTIAALQWIANTRFLFLTRDPASLSLGQVDGTNRPIVTWSPEETAPSFSSMGMPSTR